MEKRESFFKLTQQKEIQSLEEEIQHLESLLQQRKEILNHYLEKQNSNDNSEKGLKNFEDKCEDIKKQIELTTKLTGIVIDVLQYEPLKAENLTHYNMTGRCRNIRFRVEFDCLIQDDEDCQMTIVQLDTYLPEFVTIEMNKHLVRISEERSLWGFFKLLVPYSDWETHRSTIFSHFLDKYPDYVDIEENHDNIPYLMIHNKHRKHGSVFCISWTFDVDQVCTAKPNLTLAIKVPDYIAKQDQDNRLAECKARFEDMVEELGIEHSIDNIVQIVSRPKF